MNEPEKRVITMVSKKDLAVLLSMLKTFASPQVELEQYPTDSEVAATVLWHASLQGHIKDKIIADLGCGTGILGIGCLLLGAKKVYFVDIDPYVLPIVEKNLQYLKQTYDFSGKYEVISRDAMGFFQNVDVIIQNPPFGTRNKHADKAFLEKAFTLAPRVYSFHKTTTARFVEVLANDKGFAVQERLDFQFPLKNTMQHHLKRIERVAVSCFVIVKSAQKP